MLDFLSEHDIPAANMCDQGYDGTSNMFSGHVGVQARIQEVAPQLLTSTAMATVPT